MRIPAFEGPFDLLLHLIAKREVDIYEVSLATITEEYLNWLRTMQDLDLEIATEFLVVAATLIEIKAARLLPGPPVDDEHALAISERDLLIARLLEYRAFKDAAARLQHALAANAGYIPRRAGPGRDFAHLCPDLLQRVSVDDLRALAVKALTPKPTPALDLSHITPIRVTVAEAIAKVLAVLRDRTHVTFRDLTRDCTTKIDVVVRFLALLELYKRGEAELNQAETFGQITVSRTGTTAASDAAETVDEYDGAPMIDLGAPEHEGVER